MFAMVLDSYYMPLSPNEDEETPEPRTRHSAEVDDTEDITDNLYLDLLTPSPEDLRKAQAHHNSRLAKSAAGTRHLPNVRRKPTT